MDDLILNPEDTLTKKEKAWLKAIRKSSQMKVILSLREGYDIELAKKAAARNWLTPNQMTAWSVVKGAVGAGVLVATLWKIWFGL